MSKINLKKTAQPILEKFNHINKVFKKLQHKMEKLNQLDFVTKFTGEKGAFFALLQFVKLNHKIFQKFEEFFIKIVKSEDFAYSISVFEEIKEQYNILQQNKDEMKRLEERLIYYQN